MKTVLITGASGFLAREIAARCREDGWRVLGTSRSGGAIEGFDRVVACTLGASIAGHFPGESLDAVIHAANDNSASQYTVNVHGTRRWLEETSAASRPVQVFLSSLSAAADPPTDYGRAKHDLESPFLVADGVVIRLGLVVGNGGVFGRMVDAVQRARILPLLDGGRTAVHLVNPRFLVEVVSRAITTPVEFGGRIWHVHQPGAHSLKELMTAIRTHAHAHCRFIPVPSKLVLWPVVAMEKLTPVRLPLSSTNIRGLRVSPRDVPSDFGALGGVAVDIDSLVAAAIPSLRATP